MRVKAPERQGRNIASTVSAETPAASYLLESMPRRLREIVPGGTYHVFTRGSNRQSIFQFDSDRTDFLMCLERVVERFELRCVAYCLMPNHYHLVLETPDGALSAAMKAVNGRYSLRFNKRYGRDAHLFKNRFGAVLQESEEQLLWTLRYTVRNPVESGLCADPEDWPWSSYRACAGIELAPAFLDLAGALTHFGDRPSGAMATYRAHVT
jgi:REP element-mobilizing transposase RayT